MSIINRLDVLKAKLSEDDVLLAEFIDIFHDTLRSHPLPIVLSTITEQRARLKHQVIEAREYLRAGNSAMADTVLEQVIEQLEP